MSVDIETLDLEALSKEGSRVLSAFKVDTQRQLANTIMLGSIFERAKALLKKKGDYDRWSTDTMGVHKSWRNVCTSLYRDRTIIEKAQKWGKENGIPYASASDVYKLLPRWKKRDDATYNLVKLVGRSTFSLTQAEQRAVIVEYAIFTDNAKPSGERSRAELMLLRFAAFKKVLIDRLMKKAGLQVPQTWLGVAEDSSLADLAKQPLAAAATTPTSQDSKKPCEEPSTIQSLAQEPSGSPEGSYESAPSVDPLEHLSVPTLIDAGTGRRAGRERCRQALALALKLSGAGADLSVISARLKEIGLNVPTGKVEMMIANRKKI